MNDKQMCDMCGSYVARTFLEFKGKRIYLCQPDAFAMVRMMAREMPGAFDIGYRTMEQVVYGKETSGLDATPTVEAVQ